MTSKEKWQLGCNGLLLILEPPLILYSTSVYGKIACMIVLVLAAYQLGLLHSVISARRNDEIANDKKWTRNSARRGHMDKVVISHANYDWPNKSMHRSPWRVRSSPPLRSRIRGDYGPGCKMGSVPPLSSWRSASRRSNCHPRSLRDPRHSAMVPVISDVRSKGEKIWKFLP